MGEGAIRVAVAGAAGRMGRAVLRAVCESEGLEIVAAVDRVEVGRDVGELVGLGSNGVPIRAELDHALKESRSEVMVDFTVPDSAMLNIESALKLGVAPVVGTTGLSPSDLETIERLCANTGTPVLIAPNFAIGAVLMMEFAARAAQYLPDAEIIELHHEKKLDSPSGTALMTARKIAAAREKEPVPAPVGAVEKLEGARGADSDTIRIHSVRLPGFVAHQEVIFGGLGQTLTIRHDSTDRTSFMPGVLLAIGKVRELNGLVVGLENLL